MADAIDSKSIEGNLVRVQLSPRPPIKNPAKRDFLLVELEIFIDFL